MGLPSLLYFIVVGNNFLITDYNLISGYEFDPFGFNVIYFKKIVSDISKYQ
jgi:hypothetical protein